MSETPSFVFREYFFKDPYHSAEELDALVSDGWEPVCPVSVGYGYLMKRRVDDASP